MGLLIDTGVLIRVERSVSAKLDFSPWERCGDAAISVVTASELLAGVHRAVPDMRNDDGVDGDAQRISQLSRMLFLKIFDQCEDGCEDEPATRAASTAPRSPTTAVGATGPPTRTASLECCH